MKITAVFLFLAAQNGGIRKNDRKKETEYVIFEVSEPEPEKKDELTCTISVRCDTILENILSLKDKDKVEWVYACNLGKDVGEQYAKQ